MVDLSQYQQTTTQPAQPVSDLFTGLLSAGQQAASQPFPQYTPNVAQQYSGYVPGLVAPMTPNQTQAYNNIASLQGYTQPYINAATGLAGASAIPIQLQQFNPYSVGQYMSPYLGNVVNSAVQNINETNAQQQQQLLGNAISKGAFGGDRAGIAQAALARQQGLANNATLANLLNAGYGQALGEFNTQQTANANADLYNRQLAQSAASTLSNLGTAGQNAAIQQAQQQAAAGAAQQQQQQANLSTAYQQFLNQNAYPYQQLAFLGGLGSGAAGAMGGTTTASIPQPSTLSQALGYATMLGSLGGSSGLGGLLNIFGGSNSSGGSGLLGGLGGLVGSVGSGIGSAVSGVGSGIGDIFSGIGSAFGFEEGGAVHDHGYAPHKASGGSLTSASPVAALAPEQLVPDYKTSSLGYKPAQSATPQNANTQLQNDLKNYVNAIKGASGSSNTSSNQNSGISGNFSNASQYYNPSTQSVTVDGITTGVNPNLYSSSADVGPFMSEAPFANGGVVGYALGGSPTGMIVQDPGLGAYLQSPQNLSDAYNNYMQVINNPRANFSDMERAYNNYLNSFNNVPPASQGLDFGYTPSSGTDSTGSSGSSGSSPYNNPYLPSSGGGSSGAGGGEGGSNYDVNAAPSAPSTPSTSTPGVSSLSSGQMTGIGGILGGLLGGAVAGPLGGLIGSQVGKNTAIGAISSVAGLPNISGYPAAPAGTPSPPGGRPGPSTGSTTGSTSSGGKSAGSGTTSGTGAGAGTGTSTSGGTSASGPAGTSAGSPGTTDSGVTSSLSAPSSSAAAQASPSSSGFTPSGVTGTSPGTISSGTNLGSLSGSSSSFGVTGTMSPGGYQDVSMTSSVPGADMSAGTTGNLSPSQIAAIAAAAGFTGTSGGGSSSGAGGAMDNGAGAGPGVGTGNGPGVGAGADTGTAGTGSQGGSGVGAGGAGQGGANGAGGTGGVGGVGAGSSGGVSGASAGNSSGVGTETGPASGAAPGGPNEGGFGGVPGPGGMDLGTVGPGQAPSSPEADEAAAQAAEAAAAAAAASPEGQAATAAANAAAGLTGPANAPAEAPAEAPGEEGGDDDGGDDDGGEDAGDAGGDAGGDGGGDWRGGAIHRKRKYAQGGFTNPNGVVTPVISMNYGLPTLADLRNQYEEQAGSGVSVLAPGQEAVAAGDLLLQSARGGRIHHYLAGGVTGDDGGGGSDTAPPAEDPINKYARATAAIESGGGNYNAIGPKTQKGDYAYGKYQVMGANIPEWSEAATGKRMTPAEFLNDKDAQEQVFRHRFGSYLQQTGNPQDAAAMWFSGRPLAEAGDRKDVNNVSVQSYVDRFNNAMGATPTGQSLLSQINQSGRAITPQNTQVQQPMGVQERATKEGLSGLLGFEMTPSQRLAMFQAGATLAGTPGKLGVGIAAAAKTYADSLRENQKLTGELSKTESENAKRSAEMLEKSVVRSPNGILYQNINPNTGQVTVQNIPYPTEPNQKVTFGGFNQAQPQVGGGGDQTQQPQGGVGQTPTPQAQKIDLSAYGPQFKDAPDNSSAIEQLISKDKQQTFYPDTASELRKQYMVANQDAQAAANQAYKAKSELGTVAKAITQLQGEGFTKGGAGFDTRQEIAYALNTAAGLAGTKDAITEKDITSGKLAEKVANFNAQSVAAREAANWIRTYSKSYPNGNFPPEANAELLASLYMGNQMDIDRANFINWYGQQTNQHGGSVDAAWRAAFNPEKYNAEKQVFKAMLLNTQTQNGINYNPITLALDDRKNGAARLNQISQNNGGSANISRWLGY